MAEFQRSPSKVWWLEDSPNWRRRVSASPGSQDSGFSDTESSPPVVQVQDNVNQLKNDKTPEQIRNDISKCGTADKMQNLLSNVKEKSTPQKSLILNQNEQLINTPIMKQDKKPNRKLFKNIQMQDSDECNNNHHHHDQYADGVGVSAVGSQRLNKTKPEVTYENSRHSCWFLNKSSGIASESIKSLPILSSNFQYQNDQINLTAPANLMKEEDEAITSFNQSLNSDCDSEIESLFIDNFQSPEYTSTPKTAPKRKENLQKRHAMNLLLKYQNERVPPTTVTNEEEKTSLDMWLRTIRATYDQECMTTLQCKSIAAELGEKINQLAGKLTLKLREIIGHSQLIEREFSNIQIQTKHLKPLSQSLSGIITEFFEKYFNEVPLNIQKLCNDLRTSDELVNNINQLHSNWKIYQKNLMEKQVIYFVEEMEDPKSEIHVRGMITGLTALTLRDEELVNLFVSSGAIQILVVLCEKCEGSTVRALALRALSTICTHCLAIRQFEQAQGVQMIADVLREDSRPEPERSEAVALLAQITAPWIEDNHNVKGLQELNKKLIKSLTKFIKKTKCCQNLLLCAAALANLTTMHAKSIQYVLKSDIPRILLDAIKKRGSRASVYLLEQVATLIANVSAIEDARQQLVQCEATTLLLCFLQTSCIDEEVIKRLQQKSIIALSRLSSDKMAAKQIVEKGGVEKLVKLCREKEERYGSDAVLVAALATLRKIAESCGYEVIGTQDAQELVEPRLLDSFLAYSAQSESYV